MTDAELGIIGSIITTPESIDTVYGLIEPEMFSTETGQECYRAMLALYDNGKEITIVGLSARLENSRIDREDYSNLLKNAVVGSQSSAYMQYYADELVREYQSRKIKELFSRVSLLPKDIQNSMSEIAGAIELLKWREEPNAKGIKQIVEENRGRYFTKREETGVRTGFYALDELLGCLEGGDVTVIGARPSVGKSAFVTQMILQMAGRGVRVGYFNLEMSESQVYERMVANISGLELSRIRRAKQFLGEERVLFNTASDVISGLDVTISSGCKSMSQIRRESRHMNFDVIIIDYLQLIRADRHYSSRASEVGDISKAIKSLAMELDTPIVLLSQLNRNSESRETKEPNMSELRESGDIEQDASNIILMWNVSEETKVYKGLKVDKNRQGEPGKLGMQFIGRHMKFDEYQGSFEKFMSQVKRQEKSAVDLHSACDNPFK